MKALLILLFLPIVTVSAQGKLQPAEQAMQVK